MDSLDVLRRLEVQLSERVAQAARGVLGVSALSTPEQLISAAMSKSVVDALIAVQTAVAAVCMDLGTESTTTHNR